MLKGHEFHYSKVLGPLKKKGLQFAFRMERGEGIVDRQDGIFYKNTLATYTHLHALGSPEWAEGMIGRAVDFRKIRRSADAEK
jgi:cobyrinic acid a,c-diamide synthase